jgi:hypothetical protein
MQHKDDHDDGQQYRRQRNDAVYGLSELNAAGVALKRAAADWPCWPGGLGCADLVPNRGTVVPGRCGTIAANTSRKSVEREKYRGYIETRCLER